jgi:alpha-ketoglutarate-dependent taurine dioxygenase
MSQITISPIKGKLFGATVTDITLCDLRDSEFDIVNAAFLKYGFLVFPKQFLKGGENIEFAERFGELEFGATPFSNQTIKEDGSRGEIFEPNSERMQKNVGNEGWHTDSTYKPVSSKCGILSAVAVPEEGGQTDLADMRSGYSALDTDTKKRIDNLSAYHSTTFSQANDIAHFPSLDEETIYHRQAYLRSLVKTHPETGVRNLFIGRHAFGIPGLERQASRRLLKYLLNFVVSDDSRTYRHEWQVGDTVIWDNRALLHRARPYDYSHEPRVLIASRVAGDPATELAYYPSAPEAQAGREVLIAELELLRKEIAGKRFAGLSSQNGA